MQNTDMLRIIGRHNVRVHSLLAPSTAAHTHNAPEAKRAISRKMVMAMALDIDTVETS
jgi:hypothetical protein